ncbi:MAG: thrombospondin type 3 repeat-containing protein [Burkholderiales bacterium]|nr:thrombospondin type 3 repeat-containing protein [Burkholderiales bacterium]
MKKLILAGVALSGLMAGAPAVMAQGDAQSQAGSAWNGVEPHAVPPPIWYNNSGTPQFYTYGYPYGAAVPYARANGSRVTYPDGRQYLVDPRTGQTYLVGRAGDQDGDGVRDSRDTDRDGDGVKNYRDRYPDDPRFR